MLGNLDDDIKQFFGSHEPIIVPFMAFTLGQTINLKSVVTAGIPGVVLGITVVAVTGFVCILADKLLGGSGHRRRRGIEHGGQLCRRAARRSRWPTRPTCR